MGKVKDYEIVMASDPKQLTVKVKEKINDGWRPIGSPVGSAQAAWYQAMVLPMPCHRDVEG